MAEGGKGVLGGVDDRWGRDAKGPSLSFVRTNFAKVRECAVIKASKRSITSDFLFPRF